ncbi:MAG: hypothetical protein ACXWBL_08985 [Usitatibacter sp.]
MPLDLLVPDLLLPPDAPASLRELRLPALERWLARADIESFSDQGPGGWLAAAHGLDSRAPVAAISLAGEGDANPGAWLRADPVHLRIDHDALMLHDASILDVQKHEAVALIDALQRHFRGDGLEFHAPSPERWYVRASAEDLPATTPLWKAFGRNVFGLLPHGNGAFNWESALTEAQMVLSSHEVNQAREAGGKPSINSVWFWGEGVQPRDVARRYAAVHSNDAFARGLGALTGADVRPLPGGIADIDLAGQGERVLAFIDTLSAPLHRADLAAWSAHAQALEERWFAKLGEAQARFGEVRVILPFERGTRVAKLGPAARWRFFRARVPLAAHA